MSSCIRSARSVNIDLLFRNAFDDSFDLTLNCVEMRLNLPPVEMRTLIRQFKAEIACHGLNQFNWKIQIGKWDRLKQALLFCLESPVESEPYFRLPGLTGVDPVRQSGQLSDVYVGTESFQRLW